MSNQAKVQTLTELNTFFALFSSLYFLETVFWGNKHLGIMPICGHTFRHDWTGVCLLASASLGSNWEGSSFSRSFHLSSKVRTWSCYPYCWPCLKVPKKRRLNAAVIQLMWQVTTFATAPARQSVPKLVKRAQKGLHGCWDVKTPWQSRLRWAKSANSRDTCRVTAPRVMAIARHCKLCKKPTQMQRLHVSMSMEKRRPCHARLMVRLMRALERIVFDNLSVFYSWIASRKP